MEVGIILRYFSLFNPNYIALEAGEVDVPLNYVSAYFRTFSPHRNVR